MNIFKKMNGKEIILSLMCLLIFIVSQMIYFRIDLSSDKLFSISDGSKTIARDLKNDLVIDLYYSRSHPSLSAPYKAFCNRVIELLNEFVKASEGKITLNVIDPRPDSDQELIARKKGITPIPAPNNEYIYFGATLESSEKSIKLPIIDSNKEEFIEFDLAEALLSSIKSDKKDISIYSSLEIMGGTNKNHEEWAVIESLNKVFNISVVDLKSPLSKNNSVLIILHPLSMSEIQEYHIDQFLLQGGKIFLAIDPFSRAEYSRNRENLLQNKTGQSYSDLPRLLKNWGINFNGEFMVGDLENAKQITAINRSFYYPFFVNVIPPFLNTSHPITGNLNEVLLAEPGSFSFDSKSSDLHFLPLLQTSDRSGQHPTNMALYLSPSDLTSRFKSDDRQRILSGIISGQFTSAFEKSPDDTSKTSHLDKSTSPGSVTIISDVDFINDSFSIEKIPFYSRTILKPKNDNQAFFLNSIEFLAGNQNLLAIRKGGVIKRPFLRFDHMKLEAEQLYREKEAIVNSELKSLQNQIKRMDEENSGFLTLTPDQESKIEDLRESEAKLRLERREIRYKLRSSIDNLKRTLIVINLMIPLMAIFAGYRFMKKRRVTANKCLLSSDDSRT